MNLFKGVFGKSTPEKEEVKAPPPKKEENKTIVQPKLKKAKTEVPKKEKKEDQKSSKDAASKQPREKKTVTFMSPSPDKDGLPKQRTLQDVIPMPAPTETEENDSPEPYIRQTWDISRFINQDDPQEDWDTNEFFEGSTNHYLQDMEQEFGLRKPQRNEVAAMTKYWDEFNDFYTGFIEDIDFYYSKPSAQRKQQALEEFPHLSQNIQKVRTELTKYGGQISKVPAISHNLLKIVQILKEEDKNGDMIRNTMNLMDDSHTHGTMGENLEYFIENRVIETLSAYAMTDQPQGFFKFLLGAIEDLISSVNKQTSILSHISVNASVRQILRTIYDKLQEIPFTDGNNRNARQPCEKFVRSQRPSVIFYTIDILKFINTLIFKVQNEVHLIRLLFCKKDVGLLHDKNDRRIQEVRDHQMSQENGSGVAFVMSGGSSPIKSPVRHHALPKPQNNETVEGIISYDVCLPFHILVYYMKNSKCMLTPCEKNFLDDVVVMSFNSMCIDAKFACYLINESDFIEIVMSEISSSLETLPSKLQPMDALGNYNVVKQLKNVSPLLLSEQLADLLGSCKLLNQIFSTLDMQAKNLHAKRKKREDMRAQLQCIAQIQKAFLEGFVQLVLVGVIQSKILGTTIAAADTDVLSEGLTPQQATSLAMESDEIRTTIQYLIEVVEAINSKPFALVTYAFINNTLGSNFDRYLQPILNDACQAYQEKKDGKYNFDGKKLPDIEEDDLDDSYDSQDYGYKVPKTVTDDIRGALGQVYPERQSISRFSLSNPNARFSMNPEMLRSTISKFKENGIPDMIKKPFIPPLNLGDMGGGGNRNQLQIPSSSTNTHLVFQNQAHASQSSNLYACENWMEQTLAECHKTHNFIDELFNKATNLEEQGKADDAYYAQLQLDQFRAFTFPGQLALQVRRQMLSLLFKSTGDMSLIVLKLLDTLIKECGTNEFIKENLRLSQKLTRTSDNTKVFNTKTRSMLPVSTEMRHQSLSDYPQILYTALDNAKDHEEKSMMVNSLTLCQDLLSHELLHRQLIQLYFSNEYTIVFNIKNLCNTSSDFDKEVDSPGMLSFDNSILESSKTPLRTLAAKNNNASKQKAPSNYTFPLATDRIVGPVGMQHPPHLWVILMKKLSRFIDNRPNENAILCRILLNLFYVPKPVNERLKKFTSKKNQQETIKNLPLEVLQWWLYATQFDQRIKSHLNRQEKEKVRQFNLGMQGIRKKMNPIAEVIEEEKPEVRDSVSTTPSPDNAQIKKVREYDQSNKGPNFLLILSSIKTQLEEAELEEKVKIYKKVLLDDLHVKMVSGKRKAPAPTAPPQEQNLNESINSMEGTQGAEEVDVATTEEKLRDELNQPYIFRDSSLNTAENILIFNDFYHRIWQQLSLISLSISIQHQCGPAPQEQLQELHFCQEGSIVCRNQSQREMLVSRQVRERDMEAWNGRAENVNQSYVKQDKQGINDGLQLSARNLFSMPIQ